MKISASLSKAGFAIMGATYVVGALLMAIAFFFTFRRDRIAES